MSCWNCGKEGDFSGQVCDECFRKMEEYHDAELCGMIEEEGDHNLLRLSIGVQGIKGIGIL